MKRQVMPPKPTVSWELNANARVESWRNMFEYFLHITDGIGKLIDEGVLELVTALNIHGFNTRQSCAGHNKEERGRYLPPWIDTTIEESAEYITLRRRMSKLQQKTEKREAQLRKSDAQDENDGELGDWYAEIHRISEQLRRPVEQEQLRMFLLLKAFYTVKSVDYDTQIIVTRFGHGLALSVHGGLTLEAKDPDEQAGLLAAYQSEFTAFGQYLKQRYLAV